MPASLAISAKRNGLGSVCFDSRSGSSTSSSRRSRSILKVAEEGAAFSSGPLGTMAEAADGAALLSMPVRSVAAVSHPDTTPTRPAIVQQKIGDHWLVFPTSSSSHELSLLDSRWREAGKWLGDGVPF